MYQQLWGYKVEDKLCGGTRTKKVEYRWRRALLLPFLIYLPSLSFCDSSSTRSLTVNSNEGSLYRIHSMGSTWVLQAIKLTDCTICVYLCLLSFGAVKAVSAQDLSYRMEGSAIESCHGQEIFLPQNVQIASRTHPAPYSMRTRIVSGG